VIVFIIGNKIDERERKVHSKEIEKKKQEHAEKGVYFIEVSAKTGENIT
jgi:GTPase Era involved in 16S rRNA processing